MAKPEIRLKGFEGEWEKFELNQIFQERHVISTITPDLPQLSFTIEEGIIKPENRKSNKRDFLIKDKTNKKYLVTLLNDIIYNPANVIHGAIHKNSLCNGVVSPIYKIFYTDQNADFIDCVVRRKSFIREISKYMEGTVLKLRTLKPESFLNISIYIGSTIEQNIIASFFQHLDSQIQSTTKKIESLKQVKIASLQSMFPQAGETAPRVRFKGFDGKWEMKLLSNLLIERNEKYPKTLEFPLKAFIANIGVADKGERYDRSALINDVENKLYKRTYKGDFIYSSNNLETGSIGLNNHGNACISPVYSIFFCTDIADSNFIGYRLTRKDFIKEMIKWRQGVMYGQWRIHEDDFLKISLLVPTKEEQELIGNYFRTLDKQISLEEQKLEKLKQIKAACLDKMFV